jgi:hypothetical protein
VEGRQLHWSGVHRCGAWWVALGQGSRTNTAVPIVYGRNSTYNITFLVRRIVLGCTHCSDIFFSIRRRIRTIYTTANTGLDDVAFEKGLTRGLLHQGGSGGLYIWPWRCFFS